MTDKSPFSDLDADDLKVLEIFHPHDREEDEARFRHSLIEPLLARVSILPPSVRHFRGC